MRLGRANSRMKDFHDLCTLAARRSFDGELLTKAVQATFERRKADLTPWRARSTRRARDRRRRPICIAHCSASRDVPS
ncbi:MAG: nucleotidyl transferase AbiEii/AbiGii toxin family protein [Planctomycetota bacterium]